MAEKMRIFFSAHNSLAFEKLCVLFNIAAMMSQVAGNQDLDVDDGLKVSMKYFQLASGTFQHIKDHVLSVIPQGPTPDFTQDTLDALVALMLAQAQEVCFMKASKGIFTPANKHLFTQFHFIFLQNPDQMKDAVIAKVAAQTGDYYATTLKLMQKDGARSCWDKVREVEYFLAKIIRNSIKNLENS
jgi:programmed cell death 6-interacting protein